MPSMSFQPLNKSDVFTTFSYPTHLFGNHLNLGGDTWNFAPALTYQLRRALRDHFKGVWTKSATKTKRTAFSTKRKALDSFIGEDGAASYSGQQTNSLFEEFRIIATNKVRLVSSDLKPIGTEKSEFRLFEMSPHKILPQHMGDKAAFALDPARPDLIANLVNCLHREMNREFLLANHWTDGTELKGWIQPNRLKLHLASLHKPAYLIVRNRVRKY